MGPGAPGRRARNALPEDHPRGRPRRLDAAGSRAGPARPRLHPVARPLYHSKKYTREAVAPVARRKRTVAARWSRRIFPGDDSRSGHAPGRCLRRRGGLHRDAAGGGAPCAARGRIHPRRACPARRALGLMAGPRPVRELALGVLVRVARDGAHAAPLIDARSRDLLPRDRDFLRALVKKTLRGALRLDHVLSRHLRQTPESLDPPVLAALRLGAAQLLLMDRIPAHAAVGETVAAAQAFAPKAAGLVNAALRADEEDAPMDLLADPRAGTPEEIVARLAADGIEAVRSPWASLALTVTGGVGALHPLVASGALAVIDVAAQAMVELVPAADVVRAPLPRSSFASILLDAPCSGTGTLRKNPEIRLRLRPEDLTGFAETQRRLLAAALDLIAPGGTLVYVTCSLEREENEDVVEALLDKRPEFARVVPDAAGLPVPLAAAIAPDGTVRVLPGATHDGFSAAVLRRETLR